MKQRSALLVAAGLVLALGLAGFGLATGMTGPSADAKPVRPDHRTPIVHTTTRTVTIHKKGDATGSASVVPATTASSAASTVSSGSYESGSDDGYEHEHEAESEDDDSGSGSDGDEAKFEDDD
jgi:hypothetical protein